MSHEPVVKITDLFPVVTIFDLPLLVLPADRLTAHCIFDDDHMFDTERLVDGRHECFDFESADSRAAAPDGSVFSSFEALTVRLSQLQVPQTTQATPI